MLVEEASFIEIRFWKPVPLPIWLHQNAFGDGNRTHKLFVSFSRWSRLLERPSVIRNPKCEISEAGFEPASSSLPDPRPLPAGPLAESQPCKSLKRFTFF